MCVCSIYISNVTKVEDKLRKYALKKKENTLLSCTSLFLTILLWSFVAIAVLPGESSLRKMSYVLIVQRLNFLARQRRWETAYCLDHTSAASLLFPANSVPTLQRPFPTFTVLP